MLLEMNVKLRRGHFGLTTHLSMDATSAGLFGKSGAGKSTAMGLIAGTIQPESGYIVLDGKILLDSRKGIIMPPREQRPVGAVLQVDTESTDRVREHLIATYRRSLKLRRLFRLDYLIGLLELEPLLEQSIEQLSRSERQRVALADSLHKSPKLLLLDDTFSSIGNSYKMQLLLEFTGF